MPTPPLSMRMNDVPPSVYSDRQARAAASGSVFPLHVGDTWLAPPPVATVAAATEGGNPTHARYTEVPGLMALRTALAARASVAEGRSVPIEAVIVTASGTAAMAVVMQALLGPGTSIAIATPAWPLVATQARLAGARPLGVDLLGVEQDAAEVEARFEAACRPDTVALYVNSPCNPSGALMSSSALEAVVAVARRRGLWIVADEVYAELTYVPGYVPVRRLAPERTVAVHSFSKAYGMAGYRVGWVVAPEAVAASVQQLGLFSYYCAPTPCQYAALAALSDAGDAWLAQARQTYAAVGAQAAARLGLPPPEGSTFLFVPVGDAVDRQGGLSSLLDAFADRGVLVAPGTSFGDYARHVRVCFTAAAPRATLEGVERLVAVLRTASGS